MIVVAYCETCDEGKAKASQVEMELWATTHASNMKPGILHRVLLREVEMEPFGSHEGRAR